MDSGGLWQTPFRLDILNWPMSHQLSPEYESGGVCQNMWGSVMSLFSMADALDVGSGQVPIYINLQCGIFVVVINITVVLVAKLN